ncbi:recombinase XerC [Clostridium botulinum]|nr:recombinase XerC [Clostridium botulinum]
MRKKINLPESVLEFNNYLLNIKGKSLNTVNGYNVDLKMFFSFYKLHKEKKSLDTISDINITKISIEDIRKITLGELYDFINYLVKKGNCANTRNRKIATLKSYFRFLKKKKYIEENIAEDLEKAKIAKRKPICLNIEQIQQVFNSLDKNNKNYYRDKCILSILFNTGVRVGELRNIKIFDINNNKLRVVGKGDKEREIYLNRKCINDINEYLDIRKKFEIKKEAEEFLLISEPGCHLSKSMIEFIVKKHYKLAGLENEGFVTHSARHSVGTSIYHKTNSILAVAEVLGHEDVNTSRIYVTLEEDKMNDIMENIY